MFASPKQRSCGDVLPLMRQIVLYSQLSSLCAQSRCSTAQTSAVGAQDMRAKLHENPIYRWKVTVLRTTPCGDGALKTFTSPLCGTEGTLELWPKSLKLARKRCLEKIRLLTIPIRSCIFASCAESTSVLARITYLPAAQFRARGKSSPLPSDPRPPTWPSGC